MYKVLIVDDERTALNFIKKIIEKKCGEFEVAGVAENGQEALDMLEQLRPDVIITDIRMPVMDGIGLIEIVSQKYPDIFLVLVSGHKEFDYAQKALRAGVSEYLLKPIKPGDLQVLMEKLAFNLHQRYYEKRIKVFSQIVNKKEMPEKAEIETCFEAGRYYALLIRRKGLPKRFSMQNGVPIFSLAEEQFFIYGRDEMEALYLIHEKYLFNEPLEQLAQRIFERFREANSYTTAIKYQTPFTLSQLPEIVKVLYRNLDWQIVIGKNQIINYDVKNKDIQNGEREKVLVERSEYYIKHKELNKLEEIVDDRFAIWEREERSQVYVEKQIDHMLYLLNREYNLAEYKETVFVFEEDFSYVENLSELKEIVQQTIRSLASNSIHEIVNDKEKLFDSVLSYLEYHMHEEITLAKLCRLFGISQPSLSRMFRTCKQCSFSNYLMRLRMEQAKHMMQNEPDIYIKDVTEKVGYKDQFYFSRIFKSIVGISPSEYMEKERKNIHAKQSRDTGNDEDCDCRR